MVLELQELINAPWGSSTGEAQSPEKPELGKEKDALGQVCLSGPVLTQGYELWSPFLLLHTPDTVGDL